MSESIKKIILVLLIPLSLMQVIIYNKSINKNEEVNNTIVHDKIGNIKSLDEELNFIDKKEIISAQKENDIWNVKIKISGDKDDITSTISRMKNLNIISYSLMKNIDENCVILEIGGK